MPFLGEFSALLTAVLWSATSIIFAEATHRIGSVQLNINRLFFAAIWLFLTIFLGGISYTLSMTQIVFLSISGIIGLVIGDSFLFKAYQHIGARYSMLLMAISPAMTAIIGYFFLAENISWLGIIGMIITLGGIALVILERNEIPNSKYKISKIGILHGLLGALGQSGGLIFAKFAFNEGDIHGFVATFIRIASSIIVLFPLLLIAKKYKNPVSLYRNDLKALGLTIAGSVVGPYLGITFSLIAIVHTKVGIAATLMSTMPIIMLPMIKYFYKENLSYRSILGAVVAVAGIAILFLR
ncbi:MAG: DMT family transporter [Ignavibacteriaceae bacterium]|nr:DMT family transporter [Ignavibacteriaceae bacterium]